MAAMQLELEKVRRDAAANREARVAAERDAAGARMETAALRTARAAAEHKAVMEAAARVAAAREAAAAIGAREAAEHVAAAARQEWVVARVAAERAAAAAAEARVGAELGQLVAVAALLTTRDALPRGVHERHAPARAPAIRFESPWDPLTDPLFAALLGRLHPAVVAVATACLPDLTAELVVPRHVHAAAVQCGMYHALDTLQVALGARGTWVRNAAVGPAAITLTADHAWLPLAAGAATVTLESSDSLPDASTWARQHAAARLLHMLLCQCSDAAPAAMQAVVMRCTLALGTEGTSLTVVRLSVRGDGEGHYVLVVQQSVALPLWTTSPEDPAAANGLPPGLAVLLALMLAEDDELMGSPAAAAGAGGHGVWGHLQGVAAQACNTDTADALQVSIVQKLAHGTRPQMPHT